jgi:hypothetical protein
MLTTRLIGEQDYGVELSTLAASGSPDREASRTSPGRRENASST